MGETLTGIRAVLSRPAVYQLWSRLVGGERGRTTLVAEHVRPFPGERVLDLGCGPGELLPYLGDVRYTGIDISEQYIAQARKQFDGRAEFRVGDATRIDADLRGFDLVLVAGVLHHIDDEGVRRLFASAAEVLGPEGRMVSVEPVFAPGQSRAARAIIARDRGNHVRSEDEYAALGKSAFGDVRTTVRHDLLRIPYSHCVIECRGGRGG
jgi:SAM-dependent methyltransferase